MVLMDLRMPIMTGFEVTQRIRKSDNKEVAEIPIIALTADFTIDDKNECQDNGINDFILKPFSPEELLSKLVKNRAGLKTNYKISSTSGNDLDTHLGNHLPLNLDSVLEDCMGELELLEELIALYKRNALEFIGHVKMKLNEGDVEGVAFAAHKVKCGLKMMQTMELFSIVEQMHTAANTTKDERHIQFLLDRFIQEYPKTEGLIDEELIRMKKNREE
jgi:CheY-like chemotaxis protein